MGSSPRVRGTRCGEQLVLLFRGIIPACAGNTIGRVACVILSGDHPRVCGEHNGTRYICLAATGSSPRVRGTRGRWSRRARSTGIIPACAGNTVKLLDAPAFQRFRKVLIGFSQGGYLSYRMVAEHPDVFDAAILLSPSFKGEADSELSAGRTRFALCYGTDDHTIPAADQQCARTKLTATGNCTVFEYPGMAHGLCDQEIIDLRNWLNQ